MYMLNAQISRYTKMQLCVLLLFSVVLLVAVDGFKECPLLCKCDMSAGLRRARCVNRTITSLEAGVPSEVQALDLSYNLISSLEKHKFMDLGMIELIMLNMSNNGIRYVTYDAFTDLKLLKIVDLSNNRLQSVPFDLFETNTLLKSINLAGNQFISLKPGPFLESESLQTLNISRSVVSYFYSDNFAKLPRLSTLDISQNVLIQIGVQHFHSLSHLKVLKFAGNKWSCNLNMMNLIEFLRQNHIYFENICGFAEKSQKIIAAAEDSSDEDNQSIGWVNDCNIESLDMKNVTNTCTNTCEWYQDSLALLIATFTFGALIGISIPIISIFFFKLIKTRKRKYPREEYLMRDFEARGMSTPVLNRVRRQ